MIPNDVQNNGYQKILPFHFYSDNFTINNNVYFNYLLYTNNQQLIVIYNESFMKTSQFPSIKVFEI